MSIKILSLLVSVAAAGAMWGSPVWSQTPASPATQSPAPQTRPEIKLAAQYSTLAGSQRNAESLIAGLRDGKNVLLLTGPGSTQPTAPSMTFTPATGALGYGNINIALSLAKADLARQGITNPTPAQLVAALNGGTITTASGAVVSMAGVLAQRQSGMGWGQIAQAMGVKLGAVVSASKTDKAGKKPRPLDPATTSSASGSNGKSDQARTNNKGGNSGNSSNSGGGGGGGNSGGNSGGGKSK